MVSRQVAAALGIVFFLSPLSEGADGPDRKPEETAEPAASPRAEARPRDKEVPLNQEGTILLNVKNKKLIVLTEVVFREGLLEMLLCKRHTKEHESILAFEGQAYILHAGLVALGVEPGRPVTFTPEYVAPSGPKLSVELVWTDEEGKEHRKDARDWIRHSIHRYFGEPLDALPTDVTLPDDGELRYDPVNHELSWYGPMSEEQRDRYLALSDDQKYRKAIESFFDRTRLREMDADWVFAGSGFALDEASKRKLYLAESGDVICVANFPSAMVDVAAKSSAEGQESLLYEAWTERIPSLGTRVRLEISPASKEPGEGEKSPDVSPRAENGAVD